MMRWPYLLLLLPALAGAQPDPREPDDAFPLSGSTMDGGRPDFTEPADNLIGRIEGWTISGRRFDGSSDEDWITFNGADYPYCFNRGRLSVIPEGSLSQNNLRVEVLGYRQNVLLNPGAAAPITLQSCGQSPVGTSVITLINDSSIGRSDFRTFYRLRSCTNLNGLSYRFEYEITEPGFCFALSTVTGTVRDVRNGRPIPTAYVYSNLNDVTFASPSDGVFEMFVTSSNNIVLDFLAGDYASLGSVNVGPVSPSDFIEDLTLWGLPAGTLFYSGFE